MAGEHPITRIHRTGELSGNASDDTRGWDHSLTSARELDGFADIRRRVRAQSPLALLHGSRMLQLSVDPLAHEKRLLTGSGRVSQTMVRSSVRRMLRRCETGWLFGVSNH